jgi:hypothetical protein
MRADALRPILLFHSFRFVGLAFLIPGVVSPALPLEFARPAASRKLGIVLVWASNLLGTADLLNAFCQGNRTGVGLDPGLQGAAYFLPTLLVPLLLITHGLAFRLLLRKETLIS